jgi:hypothetical protein
MRLLSTSPLPLKRLFGDRVVVKEIEIFNNSRAKVGEDLGKVRQTAFCEQIMAQIKQRGGGSLGNSDRHDG